MSEERKCFMCGGWDDCPHCDEAFLADQRQLRREQLRADYDEEYEDES